MLNFADIFLYFVDFLLIVISTFILPVVFLLCPLCCVENNQVEVKLKKAEGWRWEKLENDGCTSVAKQFNSGKSQFCIIVASF